MYEGTGAGGAVDTSGGCNTERKTAGGAGVPLLRANDNLLSMRVFVGGGWAMRWGLTRLPLDIMRDLPLCQHRRRLSQPAYGTCREARRAMLVVVAALVAGALCRYSLVGPSQIPVDGIAFKDWGRTLCCTVSWNVDCSRCLKLRNQQLSDLRFMGL